VLANVPWLFLLTFRYEIASACILSLAFLVPATILAFTLNIIHSIAHLFKKRRYPEDLLIRHLIGCLRLLIVWILYREKLVTLENRMIPSKNLIEISDLINQNITKYLSTGYIEVDSKIKLRARRIAMSYLLLQEWVFTPMETTWRDLYKRLHNDLIDILEGKWHYLEQAEVADIPRVERAIDRILSIAGAILLASIPIAVYAFLQATPLALTGEVSNTVKLLLAIWTLVNLASALDNNFSSKLTTLVDLAKAVPGRAGEKEKAQQKDLAP
jgi:hypothetical protein